MKYLLSCVVFTLLIFSVVFTLPVAEGLVPGVASACQGDSPTGIGPSPVLSPSAAGGDYAIHVYDGGPYMYDGVILPVFEVLEERYAAEDEEFTVEYWFKLESGYNPDDKELFDHHIPSNEGFWTAFQDGYLWAGIDTEEGSNETAIHIQTGSGFADGNWHHYALVRDLSASPDRLCLYLDGFGSCYVDGSKPWAPVSSDIRSSDNQSGDDAYNVPLYAIGARVSGEDGQIEAVIDELRISDVARYTSNFTPPTSPFASDASTVMLFHFDEGSGNTTSGLSSTGGVSLIGTLVEDFGWYGIGFTPLDPGNPTDAAHLSQMWTDGRFGVSASPFSFTSPPAGALWLTGSQKQIAWQTSTGIPYVSLSYSTDGFVSISHTIVSSTPNTGSYTWTTPLTPSTTTRIRVADATDPATYADSGNFILTDTIYPVYLPLVLKAWP